MFEELSLTDLFGKLEKCIIQYGENSFENQLVIKEIDIRMSANNVPINTNVKKIVDKH